MRNPCLALTVIAALVPPARAEDWPDFRGPTGQGVAQSGPLPTEWDTSKNVAWKQEIPGSGWSSPVVASGKIFLTTSVAEPDSKGKSLDALCLDARTGKLLWQTVVFHQDTKAPGIHPKNSHASSSPVVNRDRLYVHFGHQGTACLDLSGKVVWRNNQIRYSPVHGNGGSPIVVDDVLIFHCDGGDQAFVIALDCRTGEQIWKTERKARAAKKFSFSTPLAITVNGKKMIISVGSDEVSAYDPKTGSEIWRRQTSGYSVIPRPVFGHGLLFVATGFDAPTMLALRPDGEGDLTDAHVAWTVKKNAPLTPSPLLVGDELYTVADNGIATCMDARTGNVHWRERLEGNFSASPVCADGKIYLQNEEGVGFVLKAGKRFEVLGRNDLGERTYASCAVADDALFIRTEKRVYRIELAAR